MSFRIRFWGVRGSIACPNKSHIRYGGNTSCVELVLGNETVILDAGTGLRDLGEEILERQGNHATLLLSHAHWDHIAGLPFFKPAYDANYQFNFYAGSLEEVGGLEKTLAGQMSKPLFPIPLSALQAQINYIDFEVGKDFKIGNDILIKSEELNHPDGATAYRIEFEGKSLCYVTDTEHRLGKMDEKILNFIQDADMVIYDSTYDDSEFQEHLGWGHSTWQEGIRLCQKANAKKLMIFHHDPAHDDRFMDDIAQKAKKMWPNVEVAMEGKSFVL